MRTLEATAGTGVDLDRQADLAIADECRLNVLWWHGLATGRRALAVECPGLSVAAALSALYQQVESLPLNALADEPGLDAHAPGSFDLVTLYGHGATRATLLRMAGLLTPAGALLIAARNRWWKAGVGRGAADGSAIASGYARTLRSCGFGHVCGYGIEPSLATPRNLVPLAAPRPAQFETQRASEWGSDLRRVLVTRAGLAMILYPSLLFVARLAAPGARSAG